MPENAFCHAILDWTEHLPKILSFAEPVDLDL